MLKTNRSIEFDILKGIGMLMVIIGHSFQVWPIYEMVNSIHMPLFFLVSGYFFSNKGTWGYSLLKNGKQLLYPYVVLSLIICVLFFFFREHSEIIFFESLLGTTLDNDFSIVLGPCWFFLALFWCRIFYRFFSQHTNMKQRSVVVSLMAICVVAINVYRNIYQVPYQITQGVVAMFYYHIGVLCRQEKCTEWNLKKSYRLLLISVSVMLLCVAVFSYRILGDNMNVSALSFPLFPMDMLNAVLLVISLYLLVKYFVERKYCYGMTLSLSWVGKNSMTIYFIHCLEYHFTIPFMAYMIESYSNHFLLKNLLIICNPFLQIGICVLGLYLYGLLKHNSFFQKCDE